MSHLVLSNSLTPPELDLDALVVRGEAQLSLDRWRRVFDDKEAQGAVAELAPLVGALKRIRTSSRSAAVLSAAKLAGAYPYAQAVLGWIKRFDNFERPTNEQTKHPQQLKERLQRNFSRLFGLLKQAIDKLGACFGFTPEKLGTANITQRKIAGNGVLPVGADVDELNKLESAISAVAAALFVHNNSHTVRHTLDAQLMTIDHCALSGELMATQACTHGHLVDERVVLPAFGEAHGALEQIERDAAHKRSLDSAIDKLIESVANLAHLHGITDPSQIQLFPSMSQSGVGEDASALSCLVSVDRRALFELAEEIRSAGATISHQTTHNPHLRPSILNRCAYSVHWVAVYATGHVDPNAVGCALVKVRERLSALLRALQSASASPLQSFVDSVRELAVAYGIRNINKLNIPSTRSLEPKSTSETHVEPAAGRIAVSGRGPAVPFSFLSHSIPRPVNSTAVSPGSLSGPSRINGPSKPELELNALVAGATSQLSLKRWRLAFDEDEANDAVAQIEPLANALKLIQARIASNAEVRGEGHPAAFTGTCNSVQTLIARLERFNKFEQLSGLPVIKQPPKLKKDPWRIFKTIINPLRGAINKLGALFGLTQTKLGTLKVNSNRIVVKRVRAPKPPEQLPDPVWTDAVALENLATDISAVAPAVIVDDDAQPTQQSIEDQITVNACARSVSIMANRFHARKDKVDKNIVVPAFERVHSALKQIQRNAQNKVSLSPAIDELIDSVKNLAFVHHINESSEIHLPPRLETTAEKRSAWPSREDAGPSKRAREASVAKAFDSGRCGAMSERRANIYGLI